METLWFCLVAVMIAMYVLLDGFDLGAGAIHFFVARTDEERRQVIATIGPVWDGNEVWLLAAGGTLYFAFPLLYASGFSGFYLPLDDGPLAAHSSRHHRRISQSYSQSHLGSLLGFSFLRLQPVARRFLWRRSRQCRSWSSARCRRAISSNRCGRTSASATSTGILDWYTVLVGVSALLALMLHGALWVQLKTAAAVCERSARLAAWTWWGVLVLTCLLTMVTFSVQPQVVANFKTWPVGFILPAIAIAGLAGIQFEFAAATNATPSSRPALIFWAC